MKRTGNDDSLMMASIDKGDINFPFDMAFPILRLFLIISLNVIIH